MADMTASGQTTAHEGPERRRSEASLRESEARLRKAISIETVGVLFFSLDGRITDANAAFERMSGYTGDELRSMTDWATLTPPEFMEATARAAGELAARGETAPYEKQIVRKDGSRCWGLFAPTRLAGSGRNSECVEFVLDVDERKRREAHAAFLAGVTEALGRLSSADEIMRAVGARVGAYLKVTTCDFCEVDEPRGEITVTGGWSDAGVPNPRRSFAARDYVTEELARANRAGEVVVVGDTQTDPRSDAGAYASLRIGSFVTAPFHSGGEWRYVLCVTDSSPRHWHADELELVRELANRVFPRVERARAEAALRESEERYRALADLSPEPAWVNLGGRIVYANPAAARAMRATRPEELIGLAVLDIPAPEFRERIRQRIAHMLQGGSSVPPMEGRWRRLDGSEMDVESAASAVPWGGETAIQVVFRDITERKRAEAERERLLAALEVERARMADVFRQAPVAIVVTRGRVAADMVFELVNPRYAEMLPPGRAPLGRTVREVLPEMDDELLGALQRVLDSGEPFVASAYRMRLDRDGDGQPEDYFFNFVYHPLGEADGAVGGVIGVGAEVTETVRAQEAAERAAARADRLQALTAALAATTTPEEVAEVVVSQGVSAAGAATGMLALRRRGEDHADILRHRGLDPAALSSYRPGFPLTAPGPAAECMRTGTAFFLDSRDAVVTRFPEIPHVWEALGTQALATVPLAVAGTVVGAMSFTFTEPRPVGAEDREFFLALGRQAAQALERARLFDSEQAARREAEAANQSKSEFLAVMSHELRTPLNAIGGYAELIELGLRGPVTDQQRADLARIQQSQRHLLGLINQVLNYTRVDAGAVSYDLVEVPVGEALAAAEALIIPQVRSRGLAYALGVIPPGLAVRADREKLQQILLNLLSNAIKFTEPGGEIRVACAERDGRVAVSVADTGIGIAPDQMASIFEPFVQVDQRLTRPHQGVGLGLAISRELARGMGGDLAAESTPGAGSLFTLTLPRAARA